MRSVTARWIYPPTTAQSNTFRPLRGGDTDGHRDSRAVLRLASWAKPAVATSSLTSSPALDRREPPLRLLVDDLPNRQREAVLARVVDERSYGDIAAQQRVSQEVVRQRVSRGLARLAAWSREGRR
jgi:DNA-directed RNA polymerase specialized sigma24 family protein